MTAKFKTHPAPHKLSGTPFLLFFSAMLTVGCGTEKTGPVYFKGDGSWRAIEALSSTEAWCAGANGEWRKLVLQNDVLVAQSHPDAIPMPADSTAVPHYRGLAVLSDALIGTAIGSPARIRRATRDGNLMERNTVWQEDHPDAFLDAIVTLDDTTLVAMGDPIDGCLCVVRSGDGGRTWAKVPCAVKDGPGVPASLESEAAFAASNGNLAASGDTVWMLSGGGASRVYRSLDRGRTWTAFDTPLQQGGKMTGGFSMDFADAFHGIVWGGNWEDKADQTGRGAVTTDGGATWSPVSEGAGPGYASCVLYRPGSGGLQLALLGTPGGLDVSEDGGQTWRHVSDSAYYAARFSPDGTALWTCGNGLFARYSPRDLGW